MDSRLVAVLLAIGLPAVLIGVTIWQFSANPVALLALVAVIVMGSFYLLSYPESF